MYPILVASLNENVKLGAKSIITNLVELHLPMYTSREEDKGIHQVVHAIVKVLENSEGYIIVAPEYNYSIPPILTNTIAWGSIVDTDLKKYF